MREHQEHRSEEAVIRERITKETQEINGLVDELIDIEEHARLRRPVPHAHQYRIKIDSDYHVIHHSRISGEHLLQLAHRAGPLEFEVSQHFHGEAAEVISVHALADLHRPGVERFTTMAKMVKVTLDTVAVTVQAGTYVVSALKEALKVHPAKVLDEVIQGEFKELADPERVHVKGGEVFVSHVRRGQSS